MQGRGGGAMLCIGTKPLKVGRSKPVSKQKIVRSQRSSSIPSLKMIPRKGKAKTSYGKTAKEAGVQMNTNYRQHIFMEEEMRLLHTADEASICVAGHPRLTAATIKTKTSAGWKPAYSCLLAGEVGRTKQDFKMLASIQFKA